MKPWVTKEQIMDQVEGANRFDRIEKGKSNTRVYSRDGRMARIPDREVFNKPVGNAILRRLARSA